MNETKLRILIADDHEMVRRGLKALLTDRPGWEVCAEAEDGRAAVRLAEQLLPDIVILDITMPELNGLEAARQIHRLCPRSEILILTMHDSEQFVREVVTAGARGYVLKNDAGRVLVQAVETLSRHRPFFSTTIADMLQTEALQSGSAEDAAAEPLASRLTPREREIVQLIAEGHSNKEVADRLGISVRTAETHRLNVMRKLNVHTASDLTRYAIRNQMIQP